MDPGVRVAPGREAADPVDLVVAADPPVAMDPGVVVPAALHHAAGDLIVWVTRVKLRLGFGKELGACACILCEP